MAFCGGRLQEPEKKCKQKAEKFPCLLSAHLVVSRIVRVARFSDAQFIRVAWFVIDLRFVELVPFPGLIKFQKIDTIPQLVPFTELFTSS